MVLKYNNSFCIGLEIFLASAIVVFSLLGLYSVVSLLFSLSFIIIFGMIFVSTYNTGTINLAGIMSVFCIINVVINGLIKDAAFSFDYFKKMIMACSFVFFLFYTSRNKRPLSKASVMIIQHVPAFLGPLVLISYFLLNNTQSYAGGLTLGFGNPNFAGMWLLHLLLYDALFIFDVIHPKKKWHLFFVPVLPLIIYLILMTRARSCLIGVFVFFFLLLLRPIVLRNLKLFSSLIAIFPLLFAVLYLLTINSQWVQSTFDFFLSSGKTLTSRVGIWTRSFTALLESPLLGNYAGISYGTGISQMHNMHVDFLCSYGIIPFVIYIYILYTVLFTAGKQAASFLQYAAYCAFCSVILMGSFEAAIVSGAMGMNLLTVGFIALARLPLTHKQK